MNIWLATIGEPLPVREGAWDRLHRTGLFAKYLAEHGHQVTWWTSTFDHFRKRHWFPEDARVTWQNSVRIILLHGRGYERNVSLARFMDHREIARKFLALADRELERPDIIVSAFPTIDLTLAAVRFGVRNAIPVLVDVRDLWPEVFLEVFPRPLHPAAKFALLPVYRAARQAFRGAAAITGTTQEYIDWALALGRRVRSDLDRSHPLGYVRETPPEPPAHGGSSRWKALGVPDDGEDPVICYFGTISGHHDFACVIRAAHELRTKGRKARFVICGAGDELNRLRAAVGSDDSIMFPGWVGAREMRDLMRISMLGLAPYRQTRNFELNITNKPVEYLAGGLPVATSLRRGVLCDFLKKENCGFSYSADSALLARGIIDLLDNPLKRAELRRNAERVFATTFDGEKVNAEMSRHLEETVAHFLRSRRPA